MKKFVAAVLVCTLLVGCKSFVVQNQLTPGQRLDAYVNVALAFYKAEHLDEDTTKFEQKMRLIAGAVRPFVEEGALEDKFALLLVELQLLVEQQVLEADEKTFWRIQALVLMFDAFGFNLGPITTQLLSIGIDVNEAKADNTMIMHHPAMV